MTGTDTTPATDPDPATFGLAADLEDWAATQHRMLTNLVGALEHAPLDALILALRQACGNGFGDWLIPEEASMRHLRPATHLVEIHVLGVQGCGLTTEEAARNWRRAAVNLTNGKDAA